MELKLMPGAFDNIPEDEQEDLFKELEATVKDGSFFENSEPVDMQELKESNPELYANLTKDIPKLQ